MWLFGDGNEGRRQTLTSIRDELRLYYPEVSTSTPNLTGEDRYAELSKRLKQARESSQSILNRPADRQPVQLHVPDTIFAELPIRQKKRDGDAVFQDTSNLIGEKVNEAQSGESKVKKAGIIELIGNMHNKDEETNDSRRWYSEYRSCVLKNDREKQRHQLSRIHPEKQEDPLIATVTRQFNLPNTSRTCQSFISQANSKTLLKKQAQLVAQMKEDTKGYDNIKIASVTKDHENSLEVDPFFSQPTPVRFGGSNVGSSTQVNPCSVTSNHLPVLSSGNMHEFNTKDLQEINKTKKMRKGLGKKALLFLKDNNLAEAKTCFEQALLDDPTNQVTLCNYAIFYMKYIKQPESVKALFLRFMETPSTDTFSLTTKVRGLAKFAHFFQENGFLNEAKDAYRLTLELDPENTSAVHRYAKLLMARADGVDSEALLNVGEQNTKLLCAYGYLLSAKGKHEEAQVLYLKCLETDRMTNWLRNYSILLRNARS